MNVEEMIDAIIGRAYKMELCDSEVERLYREYIMMANTIYGLDFEKWLNADDFQFEHDFKGIVDNINIEKMNKFWQGELNFSDLKNEEMFDFFVPRYAKN